MLCWWTAPQPLKIAIARKLLRAIEWVVQAEGPDGAIAYVRDFLSRYLNGRLEDTYFIVNQKALQNCDLVSNGTRSLDELADDVGKAVKAKVDANACTRPA